MPTVFDHLAEVRSKVLWCFLCVVVGATVAHLYHEKILAFLLEPLGDQSLFFLSPLDPLLLILKVDIFTGLILSLPVLSWSALSFVRPAMKKTHWLLLSGLYIAAAILVLCGLAYAYYVMVPLTLRFLLSIHITGIENMMTANSYVHFLLVQAFIVAVVFQIPLLVIMGSLFRILPVSVLASKRPHIYVAGLITFAIITPTTDIFSLCVIVLPAMGIFEGSLLIARIIEWLRKT